MSEPIFEITAYNPKTKKFRAHLHPSSREQRGPWRWPLTRIGNGCGSFPPGSSAALSIT